MTTRVPRWMVDFVESGLKQNPSNLNHAKICNADGPDLSLHEARSKGISQKRADMSIEVVFQNLEDRLVNFIEKSDVILGCMAWLTNKRVLRALSEKRGVSILVQKEDFLRPDSGEWSSDHLLQLYSALPSLNRWYWDFPYSFCSDFDVPPIMCVGVCPEKKTPAMSRMHHKFLVSCRFEALVDSEGLPKVIPTSVWTGSFNATENGTSSFENAVILGSAPIAREYQKEWIALMGLAEPLNWRHRWVAPEYRIGT